MLTFFLHNDIFMTVLVCLCVIERSWLHLFAKQRHEEILLLLKQKQSVTVTELCEIFNTSSETIRRDLLLLEKQGLLMRVHGGALLPKNMIGSSTIQERLSENITNKKLLCINAIKVIEAGDVIAIESGSTAIELAKMIANLTFNITVVTNAPDVADQLYHCQNIQLIMIGGQYLQEERAFYGQLALDSIMNIHVDKCFIFPTSISLKQGVATTCYELCSLSRAYISIADDVYFLCDSSKFEKTAFTKICSLTARHTIITDLDVSSDIVTIYEEQGMRIIPQTR